MIFAMFGKNGQLPISGPGFGIGKGPVTGCLVGITLTAAGVEGPTELVR
jgi:hypothetical protein